MRLRWPVASAVGRPRRPLRPGRHARTRRRDRRHAGRRQRSGQRYSSLGPTRHRRLVWRADIMNEQGEAMDIAETLRRCEEKLFEGSVRKNAEVVASMLTDDFQEFGSSGRVYSKEQVIAEVQSESPRRITMQGFRAQLLSNEIALVTYRSRRIENDGVTAESPAAEFLRSSIWVLRDNQWKVLFHQGTKAL